VRVLNNPLAQFCHNEHKAIAKAKMLANLEWDRFQVILQDIFKVLKPTFVKLAFSHILYLLNMTTWGVGSIPLNVHAKVECDGDLVIVIWVIRIGYAKVLKSVWVVWNSKSTSNKTI
jgi:hypothetical protein